MIQTALAGGPTSKRAGPVVAEAEFQVRKEKARPLLPTVWISFSGGAFGGGSNLVPPTFSAVAGRTDFDARAYWTLLNFGAGNAALIKQRKAQAGQAAAEQARIVNEIRSQVADRAGPGLALNNQVRLARFRLRRPRTASARPVPAPGNPGQADRGPRQPQAAFRSTDRPDRSHHRIQPEPIRAVRRAGSAAAALRLDALRSTIRVYSTSADSIATRRVWWRHTA